MEGHPNQLWAVYVIALSRLSQVESSVHFWGQWMGVVQEIPINLKKVTESQLHHSSVESRSCKWMEQIFIIRSSILSYVPSVFPEEQDETSAYLKACCEYCESCQAVGLDLWPQFRKLLSCDEGPSKGGALTNIFLCWKNLPTSRLQMYLMRTIKIKSLVLECGVGNEMVAQ